jgi:DNA repair exonuclease SbcCD nuclease subunit
MSITSIHTGDWQLGKPFAGVEDDNNRVLLQQERINVLGRIAHLAEESGARFNIVAGDLFDSPTPSPIRTPSA